MAGKNFTDISTVTKIPDLFSIKYPNGIEVPIILSLPHSGTYIPSEIADTLREDQLRGLDETDWYLDQIYSFASNIGITTIQANYHRWVVDLNRNKDGSSLYTDGRIITEIVPLRTFNGDQLYISQGPSKMEVQERIKSYYEPYYKSLKNLLDDMQRRHGIALLWDGHSIRRNVPGIQKDPFPDFILGTVDSISASENLINCVLGELSFSGFHLSHNNPFKGGNIARTFHDRKRRIYSMQLEMCKDLYMDPSELEFDAAKSHKITNLLQNLFIKLIQLL